MLFTTWSLKSACLTGSVGAVNHCCMNMGPLAGELTVGERKTERNLPGIVGNGQRHRALGEREYGSVL